MRLLQRLPSGELHLSQNLLDDTLPPYAILSHTWDDEEVTFRDFNGSSSTLTDRGRRKGGYEKIEFCGQQAARDGYQYFWVDSCCIDRSNSQELQEAIILMYRWYQRAAKCYVYLKDVSTGDDRLEGKNNPGLWESEFRSSRWFTRGWTLQEMLAPKVVNFYSCEGIFLGDKESLKAQIHEITGIAMRALEGAPLNEFTPAEKMAWAKTRKTTRAEDGAYALMGIYSVSMTVQYGEGFDRASERLLRKVAKLKGRSSHENLEQLQWQLMETRNNLTDQGQSLIVAKSNGADKASKNQQKKTGFLDGDAGYFLFGIFIFAAPVVYSALTTNAWFTLALMVVIVLTLAYVGSKKEEKQEEKQTAPLAIQPGAETNDSDDMQLVHQDSGPDQTPETNISEQEVSHAMVKENESSQHVSEPAHIEAEKESDTWTMVLGLCILGAPIAYAAFFTTPVITLVVMAAIGFIIYLVG